MSKQNLKDRLTEYRFQSIDNSIFPLLDEFLELCKKDKMKEELALAYFWKAEASFRLGLYEDTINNLKQCLIYYQNNTKTGIQITASAYNLLGLIFSFMGYEMQALEYYFYSIEICEEHKMYREQAVAYNHAGCLYRDLGGHEKAMQYYKLASEAVKKSSDEGFDCRTEALCYAGKGNVYLKIGEYEKAAQCLQSMEEIEGSRVSYGAFVENLSMQVAYHLGHKKKAERKLDCFIKRAFSHNDFLVAFEDYVDACRFAMDVGLKEQAKQLLEGLEQNAKRIGLTYLQLRLKRMQVFYDKKYEGHKDYLSTCESYMEMQQEYEAFFNQNKLLGVRNMEAMRSMKREKDIYKEKSRHDEMTGLLNKNALEQAACEYILSKDRRECGAMILVDLDCFKRINDTAGHLAGDRVLKNTANKMKEAFSQYTLLGRIGGDEFVVFVKEAFDRESILERANVFCSEMRAMNDGEEPFWVSVSVGIAFLEPKIHTYEQLFAIADKALYQAKECGRGRVCVGN